MFRKIATISLLTFLFFNWVGYWLFISWFESHENAHWIARLDKDHFDEDQLIVLKVSASGIPYSNPSASFERADGEIEVGNTHYRFVRKRVFNDSVEFVCIADREAARLRKAKNDILRLVTGVPDTGGHGKSSSRTAQVLLNAFWQGIPAFCIGHFSAGPASGGISQVAATCPGHTRIGKQPPRMTPALPDILFPTI